MTGLITKRFSEEFTTTETQVFIYLILVGPVHMCGEKLCSLYLSAACLNRALAFLKCVSASFLSSGHDTEITL